MLDKDFDDLLELYYLTQNDYEEEDDSRSWHSTDEEDEECKPRRIIVPDTPMPQDRMIDRVRRNVARIKEAERRMEAIRRIERKQRIECLVVDLIAIIVGVLFYFLLR